ncbi:MAG: FecR domain-containing protein [Spirochaetes bacterium]|jgi:hypothetical protein|nr:FecR domain-containing protein [Spirochaetota bacterium]
MRLSNSDAAAVAIGASIIILFSYLFYSDITKRLAGSGEVIGTITFKKKVAQRKYTSQVVWEDVIQNQPIYNYDTLRTSELSEAMVKLKDGTEIALNENSMILLSLSRDEVDIKFTQGSISTRRDGVSDADSRKMRIDSGESVVSLGKGDMSLTQTKGNELSLTVNRGKASISSGGKDREIGQDQSLTASRDGMRLYEYNLKLVGPENNANIVSAVVPARVNFSWQPIEKKYDSFLEISNSPGFTEFVLKRKQYKTAEIAKLGKGTYFWRMRAVERGTGKLEYSETRRLSVINDAPLSLIYPANNSVVSYMDRLPSVNFRWSENDIGNGYRLVISNDPSFAKPLKQLSSQSGSILIESLAEGDYYWRVSSIVGLEKEAAPSWSNAFRFSVKKGGTLMPPEPVYPPDGKSVSRILLKKAGMTFTWRKGQEIKETRIAVSRDRNFSSSIIEKKIQVDYIKLAEDLEDGEYFWRLVGVADSKEETRPSQARSFRISNAEAVTLVSPANGADVFPEAGEGSTSVSFSWNGGDTGGRYLLQVSRDPGFARIYRDVSSDDLTASVKDLEVGKYYWRVRLVDESKRVLLGSQAFSFKVIDWLEKPVAVSPGQGTVIDMTRKDSLNFTWKPVKGANKYKIGLYQTKKGLHNGVFFAETNNTYFALKDLKKLDVGNFFWTVQALEVGGAGRGKILRKSHESKEIFSIKLEEKKEKIKLKSPKVIYIE